jgi:hypothetical protein
MQLNSDQLCTYVPQHCDAPIFHSNLVLGGTIRAEGNSNLLIVLAADHRDLPQSSDAREVGESQAWGAGQGEGWKVGGIGLNVSRG